MIFCVFGVFLVQVIPINWGYVLQLCGLWWYFDGWVSYSGITLFFFVFLVCCVMDSVGCGAGGW